MIMDFLPGVPYVHTKPALAFVAGVDGLRAEPGLARVLRARHPRGVAEHEAELESRRTTI